MIIISIFAVTAAMAGASVCFHVESVIRGLAKTCKVGQNLSLYIQYFSLILHGISVH